jgi:integrase
MARRYQHLTAEVRRDIAQQVGGLLWDTTGKLDDHGDDGVAGVPAAV